MGDAPTSESAHAAATSPAGPPRSRPHRIARGHLRHPDSLHARGPGASPGVGKLEAGFFTKEIEHALLDQTVDLAVHSHKDLETRQPHGLTIAAVPSRAAAQDVLCPKAAYAAQPCFSSPRCHCGHLFGVPSRPIAAAAAVSTSRPSRQCAHRVDRLREGCMTPSFSLQPAWTDWNSNSMTRAVRFEPPAFRVGTSPRALALQMRRTTQVGMAPGAANPKPL